MKTKTISGMVFTDMSDIEEYRKYTYVSTNNNIMVLVITGPYLLHVRASKAHSIIGGKLFIEDATGKLTLISDETETKYIPHGFIALSWKNLDGVESIIF